MGKVVGIDLGTTNSVVAVMEGGKPVVIANSEGMRTTPSVVAFTKEEERLVGQMARRQTVLNPQNTYYGVKRYIGRRYDELSPESKRVPYTIRKDEFGNIKLKCPRLRKEFAPEEVSAMVLRKLAEEAARYLGEPITAAVITVPAYFNDAQRQATRNAGRIAGLEVLRILNEPTAASLAYGLERRDQETLLVFDLGGGTFDVSILEVGDGVFQVRATSGDTQLGGGDWDRKIVDWMAEEFLDREGMDLRRDRQALQRLMEAAEKAKIELSGVNVTEINLPFIAATQDGPKHLDTRLTRAQFEGMCGNLLTRLRAPVKQALKDANLSPNDIDEVVLVGGGTRMPMVKELVRSLIDREPNENVNPDEVVAVGAAIQAGILTQEVRDILLLDVTPLSIGLETIGGLAKKVIPRNTTIPVRRSDSFSTSENNQTSVEVHVVQGEREMANDNKTLGRFKLMGIPPAPRGIPQIQVSFDIDANGILQVTALDKTTGREQGITVQNASNLSDGEVQRMIQDAERFASQDRQKRDRVEKRTKAEALTYEAERQLREVALDFGMQFASNYRRKIENLIQELRACLANNDERGIDIAQADLRDALYQLQQEVYAVTGEDEEPTDFFGSIRKTLSNLGEDLFGDDDDDYFYEGRRDSFGRDPYSSYGSSYGSPYGSSYGDRRDSFSRDAYNRGDTYNRDSYNQDSYGRDAYNRDASNQDGYGRNAYNADAYGRDNYSASPYDRNPANRDGTRDPYGSETGRNETGRNEIGRNEIGRNEIGRKTSRETDRNETGRKINPETGRETGRNRYDRDNPQNDNSRDGYPRDNYPSDRSSRDIYSRESFKDSGRAPSREPRQDSSRDGDRNAYGRDSFSDRTDRANRFVEPNLGRNENPVRNENGRDPTTPRNSSQNNYRNDGSSDKRNPDIDRGSPRSDRTVLRDPWEDDDALQNSPKSDLLSSRDNRSLDNPPPYNPSAYNSPPYPPENNRRSTMDARDPGYTRYSNAPDEDWGDDDEWL